MNLTVNPYGNFSNSNRVNFQANLDISKIEFGSYPRNWSKKHWKQVADIFEKATADCPDYTYILDQNHGHFIDFKCVGEGFESVLEGTLRLAETGEKFITMSAERKADVLVKIFRMKKLSDEVMRDDYLLHKLNPDCESLKIIRDLDFFYRLHEFSQLLKSGKI